MLRRIEERVRELGLNFYELAVMTDGGVEVVRFQPSNLCQNSYSVAKAFVVTAVGMLFDQGKLDPSEKVADILRPYMPASIDPRWEKVTVDHALRHRIGFDDGLLDIDVDDASLYPTRNYLDLVLGHALPNEPGEVYQYTDAAFYLLSRIVSERAGTTCDRLLEQALFSAMNFREAAWSRCPAGHPMGATGLYIAARDMVKLGWVYVNGGCYGDERVLSETWVRRVLERDYELHALPNGWYGKGGMHGQMLMFHPEKRVSIAWHSFDSKGSAGLKEWIIHNLSL